MENQQVSGNSYYVDLVICIDGTASMKGMIDEVKRKAAHFYEDFLVAMEKEGKFIMDDWFRVKVIVFRDYKDDDEPMEESKFFDVTRPEGLRAYQDYVMGIEPQGGGDIPENALEAIFTAIKSDWVTKGGRFRRQAILLFTDATALPPLDPERATNPKYPLDMPEDVPALRELVENGGDQMLATSYTGKNGRLIVFAPEDESWAWVRTVSNAWYVPVDPNGGCDGVEMKQALEVLVGSFRG